MTNDSETRAIEQADHLYAGRGDLKSVRQSVELLRSATECFETSWRLGRAFFFLGQEAPAAAEKRTMHAEGIKAAQHAITHQRDRVEGHFWLGVNLALLAQLEPPMKAVSHALQAQRSLQRAIEIDAAYHSAGPLRVLARLQHKLPRLLGGGLARARANFERAISLAPANTVTRIYFAELLLETGEVERAGEELEAVLHMLTDPDWAFEIKRDQRLAEELIRNFAAP
ncbi:MAG: TRAP transporter TatT component family protein [Acidobacteriota bacterium]|nr:TRAP transporter TatT component family protein [Acidobacteriota bacterium]